MTMQVSSAGIKVVGLTTNDVQDNQNIDARVESFLVVDEEAVKVLQEAVELDGIAWDQLQVADWEADGSDSCYGGYTVH
jgi:hypothetical protein